MRYRPRLRKLNRSALYPQTLAELLQTSSPPTLEHMVDLDPTLTEPTWWDGVCKYCRYCRGGGYYGGGGCYVVKKYCKYYKKRGYYY